MVLYNTSTPSAAASNGAVSDVLVLEVVKVKWLFNWSLVGYKRWYVAKYTTADLISDYKVQLEIAKGE